MDRKTFNRPKKKSQTTKKKQNLPLRIATNEMLYRWTIEGGDVSSGTSGNISTSVNPSIQNSSEFSSLQTIFGEVKLVSCKAVYSPTQCASGTNTHSTFIIGTSMAVNTNTFTAPTSFVGVQNLKNSKTVMSASVKPTIIRLYVPPGLEYSTLLTGADVPNPATPFAGSPGMLLGWGSGFSNSIVYFKTQFILVHHLRGRV